MMHFDVNSVIDVNILRMCSKRKMQWSRVAGMQSVQAVKHLEGSVEAV